MVFDQIVLTGKIELLDETIQSIQSLSQNRFQFYNFEAASDEELLSRIKNADAILLGWGNTLTQAILERCPKLKYIGMCATTQHLIDVDFARSKGIKTQFLESYGSESTVEFIFRELLSLYRNHYPSTFDDKPRELHGKTLGLIGVGDIGKRMIPIAQAFGMQILYTARAERKNIHSASFVSLEELVSRSDIVSLHLPRGIDIMTPDVFNKMGSNTVLINTCLGEVFKIDNFLAWIKRTGNYCIMDCATHDPYKEALHGIERVFISNEIAGKSFESRVRMGDQIVNHIKDFLSNY